MEEDRHIVTDALLWQGVSLTITYEADWLGMGGGDPERTHAHLTITSVSPERAPLPITETGYLSHFLTPQEIEAAGGPVAYVLAWLDEAAKSRAWRRRQVTGVQLSLF